MIDCAFFNAMSLGSFIWFGPNIISRRIRPREKRILNLNQTKLLIVKMQWCQLNIHQDVYIRDEFQIIDARR